MTRIELAIWLLLALIAAGVAVAASGVFATAEAAPVMEAAPPVVAEAGRLTVPRVDWPPVCPARRTAARALRGDWGPLADWQAEGFRRILAEGVVRRTAWITCYWAGEPGVNHTTASGQRVQAGRTAAMLHPTGRRLRGGEFGGYVLISLPGGMELRQVFDTGSPRNASRARSRGAQTWVDRYVTRRTSRSWVAPVYVVGGE